NGQHYNVDAAENHVPGTTTDPLAISGINDGDVIFRNVAEGTPTPDVILNNHPSLFGGPGNDLIQDTRPTFAEPQGLYGGAGRDTFVLIAGTGDKILHFQSGAGGDVADLVGYGYTSFADVMAHMSNFSL